MGLDQPEVGGEAKDDGVHRQTPTTTTSNAVMRSCNVNRAAVYPQRGFPEHLLHSAVRCVIGSDLEIDAESNYGSAAAAR